MGDKYYTPELEEFYDGFSYEYKGPLDTKWHKENFQFKGNNPNIHSFVKNNEVRVKYLDKEDIESLGWFESRENDKHPSYDIFNFKVPIYEWWVLVFNYTDNWATFYRENHKDDIRFYGKIKNKSELKKLMKMLGI